MQPALGTLAPGSVGPVQTMLQPHVVRVQGLPLVKCYWLRRGTVCGDETVDIDSV